MLEMIFVALAAIIIGGLFAITVLIIVSAFSITTMHCNYICNYYYKMAIADDVAAIAELVWFCKKQLI